jgi:hypothetical protein
MDHVKLKGTAKEIITGVKRKVPNVENLFQLFIHPGINTQDILRKQKAQNISEYVGENGPLYTAVGSVSPATMEINMESPHKI